MYKNVDIYKLRLKKITRLSLDFTILYNWKIHSYKSQYHLASAYHEINKETMYSNRTQATGEGHTVRLNFKQLLLSEG